MATYTEKQYTELKERLAYLKGEKTDEINRRIKEAKEFGDLSENAEYSSAKEAQRNNLEEIERTEASLKDAHILNIAGLSTDYVQENLYVKVKDITYDEETVFVIVAPSFADPVHGFISDASPVGAALLGKRVGDKISIDTPSGTDEMEIIEINKEE